MRGEIKQLERALRLYAGGAEHLLLEPLDPERLTALQGVARLAAPALAGPTRPTAPPRPPEQAYGREQAPQAAPAPDLARLAPTLVEPPLPLEPLPPEPQPLPAPGQEPQRAGSLDALHVRYLGCMNCGLGSMRKNLVFGEGNPKAKLVFVGEGPGEEEDRQGRPFVGRAGQLLTQMICSLGVSRDSVYICNVVKCRPPGNRNPEAPEVAACHPILAQQLELLAPKVIVALGNVALHWLVPEAAGIKKMRGSLLHYGGAKVIPTFHPSYLLRSPSDLSLAWRDMKLVRQEFFLK